jgi:hypothetical protein
VAQSVKLLVSPTEFSTLLFYHQWVPTHDGNPHPLAFVLYGLPVPALDLCLRLTARAYSDLVISNPIDAHVRDGGETVTGRSDRTRAQTCGREGQLTFPDVSGKRRTAYLLKHTSLVAYAFPAPQTGAT